MTEAEETAGQIPPYYFRAMKRPRIREAAARLADRAREAAGPTSTTSPRSFPRKSLPGDPAPDAGPRATGAFRTEASKIVLLGPRNRHDHLAFGRGLRATKLGHRILFATAIDWVVRFQAVHQNGRLQKNWSSCAAMG